MTTLPRAALLGAAVAACSASEPPRAGPPAHAADAAVAAIVSGGDGGNPMTTTTCDAARQAIEARRFVGWTGLPADCTTTEMFGLTFDAEEWPARTLGSVSTRWHILDTPGYYRPKVSAREGVVVLFDGVNPQLDGGWPSLARDLGDPEAKLEWLDGSVPAPDGEWVYAARGVTVFLDSDMNARHIAVYQPASIDEYVKTLRPWLGKKSHK